MIKSRGLSFRYQNSETDALIDVNMQIQPGECVVLCGKSGCGKTTFSRLLNGLIPSFFNGELTGECSTFGLDAESANIAEYVLKVGSVFQNPKTQYFNVDTTAELAFPCENAGMPSSIIKAHVKSVAMNLDIEKLLDRSIFKLSGGEKQRIAFGAACMLEPKLLVLDEPTSNLDDQSIRELHDMLAKKKAEGITIVIAEHRLAWIADIADRFCCFEKGSLTEQWTTEELKSLEIKVLQGMGLRPLNIVPYHQIVGEKRNIKPQNQIPLISAEMLSVGYNKKSPVCRIRDFSIGKGEIVGLMGHNGVGKSTLIKTLCGLLKPIGGSITPRREKDRIRQSFMVMQDVNYQLFSDSVREEVLLGAAKPDMCDAILRALDLEEVADRHPMSLSGGQKQRVAIASALLSGKDFVVLDEPTSGLDYYHMTQVAHYLEKLKEQGAAVLVVTHDEELVAGWCDRVIYLENKENENGI